jgi:D-amino-acid dehydrogenase
MRSYDVIVLGAGMVGVSSALALQARGKSVLLIDRSAPGRETSYGNAGVIEREQFIPVAPPRALGPLLTYALNRRPEAHYHLSFLPRILPWLWRLFRETSSEGIERYAMAMNPIAAAALSEHVGFAQAANAMGFFRDTGWLRLYRRRAQFDADQTLYDYCRRFGVDYTVHDSRGLFELEPHLAPQFAVATNVPSTWTVSSPGGVTAAYAQLFAQRGGSIAVGDARTLAVGPGTFQVTTADGPVTAPAAVVALGPWAADLLKPYGLSLPFAVKRGYHQHYQALPNGQLSRPVVDTENGFVLTPMVDGIRLTTGIELADRDAQKTPVQLDRVEPIARDMLAMGARVEAKPWMGARPCLADSLPGIGPVPKVPGLFAAIGHGHLGFTLGPATGRLIADLVTGSAPFIDPAPYRLDRF